MSLALDSRRWGREMTNPRNAFKAYEEHAQKQGLSPVAMHLSYAFHEEQLREIIDRELAKGVQFDQVDVAGHDSTLTSRLNIENNFRRAKELIDKEMSSFVTAATKKGGLKGFALAVLSSVVAAFLYSIVVFIIVITSQDQVRQFLAGVDGASVQSGQSERARIEEQPSE
ncbi:MULTISPECIES: hypothetical protein [Luteimonas]|uniref:hypothetical protein n=1 Tax=Luteimonas TaxID=83614 RepID=UPI00117D7DBB|nr:MULTISPECIES: hypothetical protein [Luteimonas]